MRPDMTLITTTKALKELCAELAKHPYMTIDTEFLREKTYYPKLCLIQVAAPEGDPYAIDPLAEGIDLAPLFDLMQNKKVVKVFHAARQDLEIFYNLTGQIPHPLFDTQVAAMVCGFGDSVGYLNMVRQICNVQLDKGAQFTDWSRRPLSNKQLVYALDDVTYLRECYLYLFEQLKKKNRGNWVDEEMGVLEEPKTYANDPQESWQRIKLKTNKGRVLAVLREVTAWREREAQERDVPRSRIMRDETLADIAVHMPRDEKELAKARNMQADTARGKFGKALLEAVARGRAIPEKDCPQPEKKLRLPSEQTPVLEMLKMLLRIRAAENDVAARLIAGTEDLELLALQGEKADVPAIKGWRREVFGNSALEMIKGQIGLSLKDGNIVISRL